MNTFENFTNDFIRQQEVANAIIQLENRMDILRSHQTSLVRNWFCEAHPELASKMIEHPAGEENWTCYTVGVSNENPMGTSIVIRFLVGIELNPDQINDHIGYDIEEYLTWSDHIFPISDLQTI
jgi:hypothetical protein